MQQKSSKNIPTTKKNTTFCPTFSLDLICDNHALYLIFKKKTDRIRQRIVKQIYYIII